MPDTDPPEEGERYDGGEIPETEHPDVDAPNVDNPSE
jgi:hypothetical protein